jgi:glycosyltransferase involved in cell wall biosynthesis
VSIALAAGLSVPAEPALAPATGAGDFGQDLAVPDPVEQAASERFRTEFALQPSPGPGGLVVVIAAYQEAANLPAVLSRVPGEVGGLRVRTLVVDDGSTDDTARLAAEGGALVARLETNRGQGVALRLGYRLARELGADYIATLDADGQYDPEQLEDVLAPLLDGRADFVTGSRRLGSAEAPTLIRRLGTRVFAALVSLLVGQRVTDTSNGLRAMRAEVTGQVRLEQPQYQSSELLLATFAAGYRVLEVPTVIRRRSSGRSKKGPNLVYGYRYASVVLTTWWRERRTRPPGR